jgi:very-long-chain (3R)-3-hydroxyacyl-CoA dehydratase
MATIGRGYLLLYNSAMCTGWLFVLLRLFVALIEDPGDMPGAYARAATPLVIFQSGALLEVLHSLTGLIRAPIATTCLQVASRLMLLWGVLKPVSSVRVYPFVGSMIGAWSLTEIPRYAYFAYSLGIGSPPFWLSWLRYSTFIPLYPIGAGSEWALVYIALPTIRVQQIYSTSMPNWLNFSFDFYLFCFVILLAYIPGLPYMYSHMMRQRRRHLAAARGAASLKVA